MVVFDDQCDDIRPNEESENYSDDTEGDNNTVSEKNYGTCVSGLWVFGLCCKKNIFWSDVYSS